jgi:hypothetical protein
LGLNFLIELNKRKWKKFFLQFFSYSI